MIKSNNRTIIITLFVVRSDSLLDTLLSLNTFGGFGVGIPPIIDPVPEGADRAERF